MNNVALLLIDFQKGFDDPSWGRRNNALAEENAASLLQHWRERAWPVIHVQHGSLESGSPLARTHPGYAFKDTLKPLGDEKQFNKMVNSAFIGTELEEHLRRHGIDSLVIAGLTTDHCVSTSARMAGNETSALMSPWSPMQQPHLTEQDTTASIIRPKTSTRST